MRYTYAYKTSDGVRHEDSIDAESREEVFITLRSRGIRAIKVVASDGSKANGEIRGVSKRMVALAVLLATALTCAIFLIFAHRPFSNPDLQWAELDSISRRQVVGDVVLIEKGLRTGWSDVFEKEGDRFLASFAVPGVKAGQRSTTESALKEAIATKVNVNPSDSIEVRQIKAMVEGMKEEARRYLDAGGAIAEYGRRLTERQDAEIAIYERAKNEIEAAHSKMNETEFESLWEERNSQLRNLGIKLVAMPE